MKKNSGLPLKNSWLAVPILLVIAASVASAAPMPPRTLINHKTQQCAQVTPGDECGDVILPPEWEYLDPNSGEKCPDNYTMVDLQPEWTHFSSQFCCSEGHSGSSGDCQDVIKQEAKQQCAFVEDIQKCSSLPEGWESWGHNCPIDFYWTNDVVCITGESSPAKNVTKASQTQPAPVTQLSETPAAKPADTPNPLFPCASTGVALVVLASVGFRRPYSSA